MATEKNTYKVYDSIKEVIKEISSKGIPKDVTIKYKERSVKGRSTEIILKNISELIAKYNMCLSFELIDLKVEIGRLVLLVKYTLFNTVDGSEIKSVAVGSASTGDSNPFQNAMTYAFKNFLTQTFFISETEGGEIEDTDHEQVKPVYQPKLPTSEQTDDITSRAMKILDELKFWCYSNAESDKKQIEFGQTFYSKINHPKFPRDIFSQCVDVLTEYNIVNKMIVNE